MPAPPPPPPRAVLFDMDGVLVDSTSAHLRAWSQFLDAYGLPAPPGGIATLFGRPGREAVAELLQRPVDHPETRAALAELEETSYALLAAPGPGGLVVPGVSRLVDELAAAGWRLAVATSATRRAATFSLGALLDAFEAMVTADDVTAGKPDPEVYLAAAERIGVAPAETVVVEDAVAGVVAGRRAGAYVVAVPTTAPEAALREAGAHRIVPEVVALYEALPAGPGATGRG